MTDERSFEDLDELRAMGRSVGVEPVAWETPPPDLWSRIADEAFPAAPAATPVPLESRRRRPAVGWILGAAAAIMVATTAIVAWSTRADDGTVVAATELDVLGDVGPASAKLVDHDGSLQLRLATTRVDPGDGFAEVWLINGDVTELISLGPLRDDGLYDLPAGVDPTAFPIVDVSYEQFDGNPAHSGDSVLRGTLTF